MESMVHTLLILQNFRWRMSISGTLPLLLRDAEEIAELAGDHDSSSGRLKRTGMKPSGPSAVGERKLTLTPRFFGRSEHF